MVSPIGKTFTTSQPDIATNLANSMQNFVSTVQQNKAIKTQLDQANQLNQAKVNQIAQDTQNAALDVQKAQEDLALQRRKDKITLGRQLLSTVTDEASYENAFTQYDAIYPEDNIRDTLGLRDKTYEDSIPILEGFARNLAASEQSFGGTVLEPGEVQVTASGQELSRGLPEAQTDLGKITLDVQNGLITEDQAIQAMDKLGQSTTDPTSLRKEWTGISSNFIERSEGFNRVLQVGDMGTAAGDLALIFAFMKTQDPTSVVRESEFKTAADARAWLDKAENDDDITIPGAITQAIQKIETGATLLPAQRKDFVNTAGNIYKGSLDTHNKLRAQFEGIAGRSGVDAQDLLDYRDPELLTKLETITGVKTEEPKTTTTPEGIDITLF